MEGETHSEDVKPDMSLENKPTPCYGPVYAAALYPELAARFRRHGYALAVHGSLRRDFDVIAIPWTYFPSKPEDVIKEITTDWAIECISKSPGIKHHGRRAYTLVVGFGHCAIDLSFMPLLNYPEGEEHYHCTKCDQSFKVASCWLMDHPDGPVPCPSCKTHDAVVYGSVNRNQQNDVGHSVY